MRNKTITVDLESWSSSPTVLGNTTGGIYPLQPYQQALWDRLNQGGFKQGQMTLYGAVQYTGRSTFLKSAYYKNLCNEILLPMKPASKYKFSRAKWYEADYDWVHYNEVHKWCTQQFGPHPTQQDAWSRWDHRYEGKIYFRDAKDYEWFLLRWSK
jgi:hypothetical protein